MYCFRKYPRTIALLAVVSFAVFTVTRGMPPVAAFAIVALWQLSQFAMSKRSAVLMLGAMSAEQAKELEGIIRELGQYAKDLKDLPRLRELLTHFPALEDQVRKLRKSAAIGSGERSGVRFVGGVPFVSDDCARSLTSFFVLECSKLEGALENLVKDAGNRQRVLDIAKESLCMQQRTALTGTEIPLPTVYTGQVVELVFLYGCARRYATVFPLGAGTVKLPRLKAGEDDFGYVGIGTAGMSQAVPEKRVTAELVTFTANKAGGIIRIPFELEEDTFVGIGQFLARYIARQLAKLEDKTMFLADGTAAYANQTGIGNYCAANPTYLLALAATKTSPADVTLDDLRNLRTKVSPAVLSNMAANGETNAAYYLHPTWEPFLTKFNKYPNFVVFKNENGKPTLDGWPVRWNGVSQPYTDGAAASAFCAFFGDLSYWYLGERGAPRVEISKELFFNTDELALRALERIDVEALAVDAMATLQTAAA